MASGYRATRENSAAGSGAISRRRPARQSACRATPKRGEGTQEGIQPTTTVPSISPLAATKSIAPAVCSVNPRVLTTTHKANGVPDSRQSKRERINFNGSLMASDARGEGIQPQRHEDTKGNREGGTGEFHAKAQGGEEERRRTGWEIDHKGTKTRRRGCRGRVSRKGAGMMGGWRGTFHVSALLPLCLKSADLFSPPLRLRVPPLLSLSSLYLRAFVPLWLSLPPSSLRLRTLRETSSVADSVPTAGKVSPLRGFATVRCGWAWSGPLAGRVEDGVGHGGGDGDDRRFAGPGRGRSGRFEQVDVHLRARP